MGPRSPELHEQPAWLTAQFRTELGLEQCAAVSPRVLAWSEWKPESTLFQYKQIIVRNVHSEATSWLSSHLDNSILMLCYSLGRPWKSIVFWICIYFVMDIQVHYSVWCTLLPFIIYLYCFIHEVYFLATSMLIAVVNKCY